MVGIQDRQLDFEDFSTDTEKISAILKRTEVSSQKHKLTHEYYRARKFLLLAPAVLSCAAIGILGFLVTTDAIKDHMHVGDVRVRDVLTILTGCLGFFVGVVLLLGNQWDFGTRECMHLSAMIELDKLSDKVRFWKMDRYNHEEMVNVVTNGGGNVKSDFSAAHRKALGVVEAPDSKKMALVIASGKTLQKVENEIVKKTAEAKMVVENRNDVSRFSGFNGAYHQILASCKSTIPNGIHRPFDLFESRLECQSLGHLGVVWDTRMRRNQIMRLAAIEIYNEISGYWLWPLATPDIDTVIDRAMRRVARLVSKDYRAPVKVECCGFTLFRCCCRKHGPKGNLVNNIYTGMERREVELVEARKVADYMENGDKRFESRGYLLEDDAYSADRKLKRMDDDYSENSYSTRGSGRYSRSGYSRGATSYSRGGASKYLDNGTEYSGQSSAGSHARDGASYHSRDDDSYSRASQSRAGSTVYTEEGDSFTKDMAEASRGMMSSMLPSTHSGSMPQYSQPHSKPQSNGSRHQSATSRRSRSRDEPSGKQYGASGEFSDESSSYGRESIHWDEASESQYYR
ncbi:hypothetical protein HJC23_003433 [Cyclotella cryptica]|uniref:SMODS and SLOG-associating 2TM effector domain-containing protein n=1 Tax=Cyclotella cryptica TaxID=29204 RepID=A0ABD3QSI8_9STRA|eukprot:CCRYP_002576-RA/>CCRYP_002576-RA protein AED:0.06 eAED:0.06 QI:366/1/1/1/0.5/0.33/3/1265/571